MDREDLITDYYAEQNRTLHVERERYGANGARYAEQVYALLALYHPVTVLDFGCGKASLMPAVKTLVNTRWREPTKLTTREQKRHWPHYPAMPVWTFYDPGIPKYEELPKEPVDMVISTDVLEHIEPEKLSPTLTYLADMSKKCGFFTVSLRESQKTLPDGRNTHLIVESEAFWIDALESAGFKAGLAFEWRHPDSKFILAVK